MIYTVILTFALVTGQVKEYAKTCPGLPCVAAIMVAAKESQALARLRVFRGEPGLMISSNSVFPPLVDWHYQ